MRLLTHVNLPFTSWRKYSFAFSAGLLVVGIASMVARGGLRYGIDFTGGTLIQIRFEQPVNPVPLRRALGTSGFPDAEVQHFGELNELIVRVKVEQEGEEVAPRIRTALARTPELVGNPFEVVRTEKVGPKVGKELRRKALWAIFYAAIGILLYVGIRYDFQFAVAAIIATIHDPLAITGFFSLLNLEIGLTIVAALLTIIGYSINDTIVVFDRIRENLRLHRKEPFEQVANLSINQTLSRTIITGGTTLVATLTLFLLGGPVIRDFALAIFLGVITGTYSSIFVAAPILVEWKARRARAPARERVREDRVRV